jgi:HK97 family phage major capsid protein
MANPRIAVLQDEFTLKRTALDALDALAATEARDLTADEQIEYDANVTRMEAIDKTVIGLNAQAAKFDGAAAGNVAAGLVPGGQRQAARANSRIVLAPFGEQLLIRGQHALGGRHAEAVTADYETLVRSFDDETLQRVVSHGVSSDGTAPVTVEGNLVYFVDANRYAVNAANRKPMPDNHAPTFLRPRVTQSTTVAKQVTQGDILSSQRFQLTGDTITKATYGGVLSLSEQEVDWTDPAMLGLAIQDLARQYAIQTSTAFTAALVAAVTEGTETALSLTATLALFVAGIAASAAAAYATAFELPDTLFVAPDRFFYIAGLTDTTGRPAFPVTPSQSFNSPGSNPQGVTKWGSMNVLGLNVVTDPTFAANTMITAVSEFCEVYEQDKGLLTIAAPSTLEVQYAYRGYFVPNVYSQALNGIEVS